MSRQITQKSICQRVSLQIFYLLMEEPLCVCLYVDFLNNLALDRPLTKDPRKCSVECEVFGWAVVEKIKNTAIKWFISTRTTIKLSGIYDITTVYCASSDVLWDQGSKQWNHSASTKNKLTKVWLTYAFTCLCNLPVSLHFTEILFPIQTIFVCSEMCIICTYSVHFSFLILFNSFSFFSLKLMWISQLDKVNICKMER